MSDTNTIEVVQAEPPTLPAVVYDEDLQPEMERIWGSGFSFPKKPAKVPVEDVVSLLLEYLGLELGTTTINERKTVYLVEGTGEVVE